MSTFISIGQKYLLRINWRWERITSAHAVGIGVFTEIYRTARRGKSGRVRRESKVGDSADEKHV